MRSQQYEKEKEIKWNPSAPGQVLLSVALLLFLSYSANAQTLQCRTNYYTVTGATEREIRHSMTRARQRAGTGGYDAQTTWKLNCRFTIRSTRTGYCVNTLTTQTAVVITLPRWQVPDGADESVRARWARFVKALEEHEAGHVQCARTATAEVHRQVRQIGEVSSQESLSTQVNDLMERVTNIYRNHEKVYDQRTRHGATQGATFPQRPDKHRVPRLEDRVGTPISDPAR